jgi:uncharacterized membrane protein YqjE
MILMILMISLMILLIWVKRDTSRLISWAQKVASPRPPFKLYPLGSLTDFVL